MLMLTDMVPSLTQSHTHVTTESTLSPDVLLKSCPHAQTRPRTRSEVVRTGDGNGDGTTVGAAQQWCEATYMAPETSR